MDIVAKIEKPSILTAKAEELKLPLSSTGFTETDPTVPAWAKQKTKPSYTAAEVGAATEEYVDNAVANAGGGNPEKWEYIGEFNVGNEDVASWYITEDSEGNPIELKKMYFERNFQPSATTTQKTFVEIGNPAVQFPFRTNGAYFRDAWLTTTISKHGSGEGIFVEYVPQGDQFSVRAMWQASLLTVSWSIGRSAVCGNILKRCIAGLALQTENASTGLIGAGSTIKIWGVRV